MRKNKLVSTIFILMISFGAFAASDNDFKDMYLCFRAPLVKVKAHYDSVRWPDSDFANVCSLSLTIDATNPSYFYYSRKWRDPDLCKKFVKNWNNLKNENKKVCIAARLGSPEKVQRNGNELLERSAPYEVIKIGNWCHSYFDGYCD
jgi:hypothetical protein